MTINKNHIFKRRQSIEGRIRRKDVVIKTDSIQFNTSFALNIAHGNKNYVVNIANGSSFKYQRINAKSIGYFEISSVDASLDFKQTTSTAFTTNPVSNTLPEYPEHGQLFFDSSAKVLKRWNGECWNDVIGLVLGVFSKEHQIEDLYVNQSQANINVESIASEIVFDRDRDPIRLSTSMGFEFLTEKDREAIGYRKVESLNFENKFCKTIASTLIQEFTVVHRSNEYKVTPATTRGLNAGVALTLQSVAEGNECIITERGFVTNKDWAWSLPPMTPLFFDIDGLLTVYSPLGATGAELENTLIVQKVGHIVDPRTIFFSPEPKYII